MDKKDALLAGCGTTLKAYGHRLPDDPDAANAAGRTRDVLEFLAEVGLPPPLDPTPLSVAYHAPCSLQHGLKLKGRVEEILHALGLELTPVPDAHLCCGSAGTYSILQPAIAKELKRAKLAALGSGEPDVIASANIGCIMHLADGAKTPVRHWIELLDARMVGGGPRAPL